MTIFKYALAVGSAGALTGGDRTAVLKDFESKFKQEIVDSQNKLDELTKSHDKFTCDMSDTIAANDNSIKTENEKLEVAKTKIADLKSKISANTAKKSQADQDMQDTQEDQKNLVDTWKKEKDRFAAYAQKQAVELLPAYKNAADILVAYTAKASANVGDSSANDGKRAVRDSASDTEWKTMIDSASSAALDAAHLMKGNDEVAAPIGKLSSDLLRGKEYTLTKAQNKIETLLSTSSNSNHNLLAKSQQMLYKLAPVIDRIGSFVNDKTVKKHMALMATKSKAKGYSGDYQASGLMEVYGMLEGMFNKAKQDLDIQSDAFTKTSNANDAIFNNQKNKITSLANLIRTLTATNAGLIVDLDTEKNTKKSCEIALRIDSDSRKTCDANSSEDDEKPCSLVEIVAAQRVTKAENTETFRLQKDSIHEAMKAMKQIIDVIKETYGSALFNNAKAQQPIFLQLNQTGVQNANPCNTIAQALQTNFFELMDEHKNYRVSLFNARNNDKDDNSRLDDITNDIADNNRKIELFTTKKSNAIDAMDLAQASSMKSNNMKNDQTKNFNEETSTFDMEMDDSRRMMEAAVMIQDIWAENMAHQTAQKKKNVATRSAAASPDSPDYELSTKTETRTDNDFGKNTMSIVDDAMAAETKTVIQNMIIMGSEQKLNKAMQFSNNADISSQNRKANAEKIAAADANDKKNDQEDDLKLNNAAQKEISDKIDRDRNHLMKLNEDNAPDRDTRQAAQKAIATALVQFKEVPVCETAKAATELGMDEGTCPLCYDIRATGQGGIEAKDRTKDQSYKHYIACNFCRENSQQMFTDDVFEKVADWCETSQSAVIKAHPQCVSAKTFADETSLEDGSGSGSGPPPPMPKQSPKQSPGSGSGSGFDPRRLIDPKSFGPPFLL